MLRSGVSMFSPLALGSIVPVLWLVCATPTRATAAEVPPPCTPTIARIVSMQGVVEIRRAGQPDWAAVTRLDTPVCQGDLVHAGARSRAALVILPEKFVRLDQNSTLSIAIEGEETVVEFFQDETTPRDACGAGYFITRFPRKFKVRTPFVNAAVEGTEFLVSMSCSASSVAVFEGKVSAETLLANAQRFILNSGEAISAGPGEPPAIKVLVRPVDAVQWALYYPPLSQPGPGVGPDQLCDQAAPEDKSRCLMVRAEQRLRVGRVDEAQADIDASLKLVPDNSDANALLSVISVVKNERQRALALAQRATQLDPVNPRAWIALSYAQQASFKLEDALSSAQRAAELEPRSSIALTRMAELMMSLGRIRSAERAAQAAVDANPNDSRAHTILGFVRLAQIDIRRAKADFETAIALDSSDPLPRLGLGLAIIRSGNLTAGREQIEIAVALDPTNSLLRSYVGKAYFEENTSARDKLAATQYGLAKQLDPRDPTPWFYEAILKQTQNRPIEALQNLQKSIGLNDNRAVYRSRLLLDEDRATRTTSLARVYTELGLPEFAVTEASKSLLDDPGNYSAHRFLSDAYSQEERQDIARVSELLQAQLLQPVSVYPVRPATAFTNLKIAPSALFAPPSYDDYARLFVSDGLSLQASGLVGNLETFGNELTVSGLDNGLSFSLGQFHYQTNGFRPNNDHREDLYDLFVQATPSDLLSLQVELRRRETQQGDLRMNGDPLNFDPSFRRETSNDVQRFGARLSPAAGHDFLLSVIHGKVDDTQTFAGPLMGTGTDEGNQVEAQYLWRTQSVSIVAGVGWYGVDQQFAFVFDPFCPPGACETNTEAQRANAYVYTNFQPAKGVNVVLGLSYDALDDANLVVRKFNPKLGLQWQINESTSLRLAAFQVVRPTLVATQTIEPAQVVGFSQLYDDLNGTVSRRYAIALDIRPRDDWFLTFQASRRSVEDPFDTAATPFISNVRENTASASISKSFARRIMASVGYTYEQSSRSVSDAFAFGLPAANIRTQTIPVAVRYFNEVGFLGELSMNIVRQEVLNVTPNFGETSGTFSVVNAGIGYRFPRRRGLASLEVNNVFDRSFAFQNLSFHTNEPLTPRFLPTRTIVGRIALYF